MLFSIYFLFLSFVFLYLFQGITFVAEVYACPSESVWFLSWGTLNILECDIHLVQTFTVFEVCCYLARDVDIAIGRGALGVIVVCEDDGYINFHSVALFDVGDEVIAGEVPAARNTRLLKLFVFSGPLRVFAIRLFVPSKELVHVVFLQGLDILLGVDPLFVVGIFFGLTQHLCDLPWNVGSVLIPKVRCIHVADPPAVAAVIWAFLIDPVPTTISVRAAFRRLIKTLNMNTDR